MVAQQEKMRSMQLPNPGRKQAVPYCE